MQQENLKTILEQKNIKLLDTFKFSNSKEEIDLLNKIDELNSKEIKINFLNKDLITIIQEIKIDENTIDKLKLLNWEDFTQIIEQKDLDKRKHKIYLNFLQFLKAELNILREEKPLTDKTLIEEKNPTLPQEEDEASKIDLKIFKKQENFDTEKDTIEKAHKFDIEIISDYNEPSHKLSVSDFTLYFNKRLHYFTELLKNRISLENVTRISKLKDLEDTNSEVSVIGLISEFNYTKNGHLMLTIEDKSAQIKCFVNKKRFTPAEKEYDKDLAERISNLCLDEGIGIHGKIGKDIIWVDDIVIPSPPNTAELKKTEKEEYVCFISDIHFGAKVFVDDAFQRFVDFLNGQTSNENLNKIANKIKYIVVAGDLIEGIGIYPNQGKDARIMSTELQYHETARWFSQIPKDKCIISIPGNHDTDRLSEPQPKLPYHKAYALYNMENSILLSNPSIIKLFQNDPSGGLELYLYHGGSIFYYADNIQHLRQKGGARVPEEVVKFLLEKRHLAPSHGSTLYIPDNKQDPLVIKKMPDFFVTGHTHKLSIANYKGCTILSCGCWVEMSDYQEKLGMYPDIGKCIIVNTKTRRPQIINFYTGDGKPVKRDSSKDE